MQCKQEYKRIKRKEPRLLDNLNVLKDSEQKHAVKKKTKKRNRPSDDARNSSESRGSLEPVRIETSAEVHSIEGAGNLSTEPETLKRRRGRPRKDRLNVEESKEKTNPCLNDSNCAFLEDSIETPKPRAEASIEGLEETNEASSEAKKQDSQDESGTITNQVEQSDELPLEDQVSSVETEQTNCLSQHAFEKDVLLTQAEEICHRERAKFVSEMQLLQRMFQVRINRGDSLATATRDFENTQVLR